MSGDTALDGGVGLGDAVCDVINANGFTKFLKVEDSRGARVGTEAEVESETESVAESEEEHDIPSEIFHRGDHVDVQRYQK